MEKRQAIILLVLVLAVSLASFTLGVIVGRRGAERDLAQQLRQTEKVLVAPATKPARPAVSEDRVEKEAPVEQPPDETAETSQLSFYEDLAKDETPLGSGINLPPEVAEPPADLPLDLPEQPLVEPPTAPQESAEVAATEKRPASATEQTTAAEEPALPVATTGGSHVVQIGSFQKAADAIALKQKMEDKSYPAYVMEADLGEKGLWYRVRVGAYSNADQAGVVRVRLEEKDRIEGFVTRR
jgi:cell division septation protein DedD